MRYQLDNTMRFRHIGTILNCADNTNLNPDDFTITSDMVNIKTKERHAVTVRKDGELVEFTVPPDTLTDGLYEWRCYLSNEQVRWGSPKVTIKVT